MDKNFKISLKAARVNQNLTQEEVAKKIQVSKHTIINWEKNKTKIPYVAKLYLARLYDVNINNLI